MFSTSICLAVDLYDKFVAYPNNKNLILRVESYQRSWDNVPKACFYYKNIEGAKLNGRIFDYEYLCLGYNFNNDTFVMYTTNQSAFIYSDNTYIYSSPYFFRQQVVQIDIIDMFSDIHEGVWSDRN